MEGGDIVSPESAKTNTDDLVEVRDIICPKGWSLPLSGWNDDKTMLSYGLPFDRGRSYYRLLLAYGYPVADEYGFDGNHRGLIRMLNGIAGKGAGRVAYQNLSLNPVYLTRSGLVDPYADALRIAGLAEYVWSSTVTVEANNAYDFVLSGSGIYTVYINGRANGFSIRCLAK